MIEKLQDKEQEFVEMMREQMEKELASLKAKREKKKDLERLIDQAFEEIEQCEKEQTLFTDGENFM